MNVPHPEIESILENRKLTLSLTKNASSHWL